MEFSRQEHWTGWLFPSPGDLPDPGIEPRSPALQADFLPSEPPGKHKKGINKAALFLRKKETHYRCSRYQKPKLYIINNFTPINLQKKVSKGQISQKSMPYQNSGRNRIINSITIKQLTSIFLKASSYKKTQAQESFICVFKSHKPLFKLVQETEKKGAHLNYFQGPGTEDNQDTNIRWC